MAIQKSARTTNKPQTVQQKRADGQVRIISGKWRGRKLPVADFTGLRPTSDRIKETVFNWLAPHLYQSHCLDCFAGSGALGFEALSRQAEHVVLLETNPQIVQILKKNQQILTAENLTIIQTDTLNWLANSRQPADTPPFNIVFLDPPFHQDILNQSIGLLEKNNWLANECWIYVETEFDAPQCVIPPNWQLYREKIAGQVTYRLYYRQ